MTPNDGSKVIVFLEGESFSATLWDVVKLLNGCTKQSLLTQIKSYHPKGVKLDRYTPKFVLAVIVAWCSAPKGNK